jgi:hypothetical protein
METSDMDNVVVAAVTILVATIMMAAVTRAFDLDRRDRDAAAARRRAARDRYLRGDRGDRP